MSTEAQRNAANGSGNMFTMSADLSEIAPVAPIARNGYAPFAKSTPDALVSTDPIVAPSVNGISLLPDGSTSFPGPLRVAGGVAASNVAGAHNQIRVAIDGDSIAENRYNGGVFEIAIAASHGKFALVRNQAVGGGKVADVEARISNLAAYTPDEVWTNIGINDLALSDAFKEKYLSMLDKIQRMGARPVIFLPNYYSSSQVNRNNISAMNEWIESVCRSRRIECNQMWDHVLLATTGNLDPSKMDTLVVHPDWGSRTYAGTEYMKRRMLNPTSYRRNALGLYLGKWAADPFSTTGTASQGGRWITTNTTNSSATWSKIAASYPDVGNWQRCGVTLNAGATADLTWICSPNNGIPIPEGELEVSYRLKCSSFVNLNLDAHVWINNNSGQSVMGRVTYHSGIRGDFDGTVNMVIRIPAGAYQPQLTFIATAITDGVAASGNVDVAMIGIKTLVP